MNCHITFIGIAHSSSVSLEEVKSYIEQNPNIDTILLELDIIRYESIYLGKRFKSIAHFLGYNIPENCKPEIYVVQNHPEKTYFIDIPFDKQLKMYWKHLPWKTKLTFFINLLLGAIFQPKKPDMPPPSSLAEVQLINAQLSHNELHKLIVDARDKYMYNQITNFIEKYKPKKIVVITGAGHLPGLLKLFNQL
jgi:pheromone shutdown protein TraB